MIAISTIVYAVLFLIVAGLIWGMLYWLVNHPKINLQDPWKWVANVVLLVGAVFILIGCLLHLIGINVISFT